MDPTLADVLADHQAVGAIGRRSDLDQLVQQSLGFLEALGGVPPGAFVVDVGSGGGVPALPIVVARPDLHVLLVERRASRAGLLRGAIRRLQAEERAEVFEGDVRRLHRLEPAPWYCTARCAADPAQVLRATWPVLPAGSVLALSATPTLTEPGSADEAEGWTGPVRVVASGWHYLRWSRA
jgi:16S rRNA (guanine527-N7)-methyltransferase